MCDEKGRKKRVGVDLCLNLYLARSILSQLIATHDAGRKQKK
jgi:hypothetical protein